MQPSDPVVLTLRDLAKSASERAYCPYSKFHVGAAVLVEGGATFCGANVENASLGLSMCAERTAIFQAVSRGHRRILAVAVYTPTSTPTTPCGACRQVIHEFGSNAEVFCFCNGPAVLHLKCGELFPQAFGPESLT